jgi:hypothetical protein
MDGLSGVFGQLELDRTTGFPLHDNGTLFDTTGHVHIADTQRDQVTTAQLAVNGQVE